MRTTQLITHTATAAAMLLTTIATAAPIQRERSDARDALKQLECKPLDPAAISSLADWSHAGVLDPENTASRVVLLSVVSAADPKSIMTLSTLKRMARDYKDQGLVVAAIHPDLGFELMSEKIASGRIGIPVARDEGAAFTTAMHTDDYPDLYLIDLAGNLRFADLDQRSLKDALKLLTSESPESAAANAALQAQGQEPTFAPTPTTPTQADLPKHNQSNAPSNNPKASNTTTKAYSSGGWPDHNRKVLNSPTNWQGKPLPVRLGLNEEWISEEHTFEDRVLLIDFWATFNSSGKKAAKIYNKLLEKYPDQLEVVGISGSKETKERVIDRLSDGKRPYTHLYDANDTLYNQLGITAIPTVLIISTDGIIRWQGIPLTRGFEEVVDQIIAADPKVNH